MSLEDFLIKITKIIAIKMIICNNKPRLPKRIFAYSDFSTEKNQDTEIYIFPLIKTKTFV